MRTRSELLQARRRRQSFCASLALAAAVALALLVAGSVAPAAPPPAQDLRPAPVASPGPVVTRVDVPAGTTATVLDTNAGQVVWLTEAP